MGFEIVCVLIMKPKQNHLIFRSDHPTIDVSWSFSPSNPFRLIYTTFSDSISSHLHLLDYNCQTDSISKITSCPPTTMLFSPTSIKFMPKENLFSEIFVSSGDNLRLFSITQANDLFQLSTLDNAFSLFPSCGFDWCIANPDLICCWYLNNTCCVWNIELSRVIASFSNHISQPITDMKYSPNSPDLFITTCENGLIQITDIRSTSGVHLFPQRNLTSDLMKVSWNCVDSNKIATFNETGKELFVMDIRQPTKLFNHLELNNRITSMEWSNISSTDICIGTEKNILIWSLKPNKDNVIEILNGCEVNNVCWSKANPNWISASIDNSIHFLHV